MPRSTRSFLGRRVNRNRFKARHSVTVVKLIITVRNYTAMRALHTLPLLLDAAVGVEVVVGLRYARIGVLDGVHWSLRWNTTPGTRLALQYSSAVHQLIALAWRGLHADGWRCSRFEESGRSGGKWRQWIGRLTEVVMQTAHRIGRDGHERRLWRVLLLLHVVVVRVSRELLVLLEAIGTVELAGELERMTVSVVASLEYAAPAGWQGVERICFETMVRASWLIGRLFFIRTLQSKSSELEYKWNQSEFWLHKFHYSDFKLCSWKCQISVWTLCTFFARLSVVCNFLTLIHLLNNEPQFNSSQSAKVIQMLCLLVTC